MAYGNRGLAYALQRDYQQAVNDFDRFIKINPQSVIGYINRGFAYMSQGNYQQAVNDFNQTLKINPQFALAYLNRGFAYLSQGDYPQAIRDFNRALKINPQLAMAYLNPRISHKIILTSHNPYVAKARQNQRFDSVLFFFVSFEGVQSFAKQSFQRLRSQTL